MNKNFTVLHSFRRVFHGLIITIFFLGLQGCGYKAAPFYIEDAPSSDENVEFKIRKVNVENNESQACEKEK